ncbi:glycosyltransferase [Mucilaginibacter sp. BJC16-A38]|uniref:glycosyltransferase n=1 Tax=Mucilaginibacter phenanthrenivorans TaxID=1234842 RepID=UPI0021583D82|nr:glycosyltransferase [Mucilaginibacter phenanthrenivorans]MCR8558127.1 glycosyltransferase [Mucilaginibacter phenanthrenivorans]
MQGTEIWIAGYPGFIGGADTELFNNIHLWIKNGVRVNLVPMSPPNPPVLAKCNELGCVTHTYFPAIFKNKVVASFCCEGFLESLPEIMDKGRPARVIWFNCMTWHFPDEIIAHQNGWIDLFGFVSAYQEQMLRPGLEEHGPVNSFTDYSPYFNLQDDMFCYQPCNDRFVAGRCSRDDASKYPGDLWRMFYKISAPLPVKTVIMGWGENAAAKCGFPPLGMEWEAIAPNQVPVSEFYKKVHCILHKTGGSRESYCRIVPEAYAHGVAMIAENDFAFPGLIENGVTGFLCNSSDEMSYRASQLAFDEDLRKKIIYNGFAFLKEHIANDNKCWEAWKNMLS